MSQLVLAYLDKVVLGAAMLGLAFSVKGAVSTRPSATAERELTAAMQTIEAHAPTRAVPSSASPGWAAQARAQLRPEGVPEAAAWPAWSCERRPALVFDAVPAVQPPGFVNEPVTEVTAVASEPGSVVVRWTPGRIEELAVTYVVERRGDGEWERVAQVDVPACEAVDTGVAARRGYAYRVLSLATVDEDDRRVRAARAAGTFDGLAPAVARVASEPSAEVTTPTDLFVVPRSVDEGATAFGEVLRWDAVARAWKRGRFGGKVGEQVAPGLVLQEAGIDRSRLWVKVRVVATGEVLEEDSRRERLPALTR